jgi:acetylornithine deacetylase/succinyl-diaminopimelate desuccinylase-like protein
MSVLRISVLIPLATAVLYLVTGPAVALQATDRTFSELTPNEQLSEDILRELVAYETTSERPEQTREAFEATAERLLAAGFPPEDVQVVNPADGVYGLVARYRGTSGLKPILVLAHMDVVTATPDAWSFPPFSLGLKDGYYLGRGTSDNKTGVVQIIANFIRLQKEGWQPRRDIIAAITGDEETEGAMASWFANEGRHLVDAEYAINSDAGGGEYSDAGERRAFWIQNSEKVYHTVSITTSNAGGHSSLPRPDNAIEDMALVITRLAENPFPILVGDSVRMQLQRSADLYPEAMARDMHALVADPNDLAAGERLAAADPVFNAMLRTTCTPTMLSSGHAENALPRDAVLTLNCRILPGTAVSEVEARISELLSGLDVEIAAIYDGLASEPSDLPDAFLVGVERLVTEHWEGVPVIPSMSTGATDGLFYRNAGMPVYGVGAIFSNPGENRSHGLDERVGIFEFHESVAFWYRLLQTVGE